MHFEDTERIIGSESIRKTRNMFSITRETNLGEKEAISFKAMLVRSGHTIGTEASGKAMENLCRTVYTRGHTNLEIRTWRHMLE